MKKRDFILIGVILTLAISVYAIFELTKKEGSYVVVTVGSGQERHEIARYYLSEDGEYSLNGGTNTLKIEGGKAWMIDATCPQTDADSCTKHPKISKTNESIACLPNNLVVTVHGDDIDEDEPELVVGQ